MIVPLFALANAGVVLSGDVLATAFTAPVTLGVFVGYVVGKPLGVVATAWAVTRISRGRIRPPVGWAAVLGSGTIAGVGFTVALLIATRAFQGAELDQAKVGALSAVVVSAALTWLVYRLVALLPSAAKARALVGDVAYIQDLVPEVDIDHDHIRGPVSAPITVIEFGDFECPYCGQAEAVVRELLSDVHVRYVWRHLPLTDVHPRAQYAAEAAEAAAAQGAFWEMHDLLLAHQGDLRPVDVARYAEELGLDMERFADEMRRHVHETRVAQDVESADLSGVSGTPTFFVNGLRQYGAYDVATLGAAVRAAQAQVRAAPALTSHRPALVLPAVTVDWSTEWLSSLIWIAVVTVLALLGSAIVLALVTRLTRWGRQFRRLVLPVLLAPGRPGPRAAPHPASR